MLYTITSDSVLRIFMPVLDSLQYLQLHGAIDVPFTPPSRFDSTFKSKAKQPTHSVSSIFWLDRKTVGDAFRNILQENTEAGEEDARRRRAREVIEEGWDLFLRVMGDGSMLVTAVAVCPLSRSINVSYNNSISIEHRWQAAALPQTIHTSANGPIYFPQQTSNKPIYSPHHLSLLSDTTNYGTTNIVHSITFEFLLRLP